MAISTYPAAAGGGIKSVQRGSAAGAGTVTITAVDITKSFVNIFGTASSGTIAASGTISAMNGNIAQTTQSGTYGGSNGNFNSNQVSNEYTPAVIRATTFAGNTTNISGGSNNLVAAVVQGYLSSSTELIVSGACRWEVVEFN